MSRRTHTPAAAGRGAMSTVHSRAELDQALTGTQRQDRAVVMTMGALHAGHASLFDEARRLVGAAGQVVATVYVNPLQFHDPDDLSRYPRTLAADAALAAGHGVDVLWAPTAADVFPHGSEQFATEPGPLGDVYEGAARPGHFAGMLTVVRALLAATQPALAVFGEKDYQQLALIRRMVADLGLPTQVVGAITVREPDGLAMSSRNRFLSPREHAQALALSRALAAGAAVADAGGDADAVLAAAGAVVAGAGIAVDYLDLVGEDFAPLPAAADAAARLLIAARVGDVRLIDNAPVTLRGSR